MIASSIVSIYNPEYLFIYAPENFISAEYIVDSLRRHIPDYAVPKVFVKQAFISDMFTGAEIYCQKDMELYYKKLNLFVLPSVVKEAFGLVLCEAMYCGIPIITTDSGAQSEIITNKVDGIIVRNGDIDELEKSILKIYKFYQKSNFINFNLGKQKVLNNFSINKCVNSIIQIYKEEIQ